MRKSLGNYVLRKKISKAKREVQVFNLETAKSIGVLYPYTLGQNEEVIKKMIDFLESFNTEVQSIAMVSLKNATDLPVSSNNNFYFSKKEINFYKIPTSKEVHDFIDKEFDILIDCNLENLFPLRYISSLSKAKFKVGPSSGYRDQVCDMTISMEEPVKMEVFLDQAKRYLKIINQQ